MPVRLPNSARAWFDAPNHWQQGCWFFLTKLGLGPNDAVLEAGIGSGGLSLYIQRVLGKTAST